MSALCRECGEPEAPRHVLHTPGAKASHPFEPVVALEIHEWISEYRISHLPEGHEAQSEFTLKIVRVDGERWGVVRWTNDGRWLSRSKMVFERVDFYDGGDRFDHLMPLEAALELAREMLPRLRSNRWTAEAILAAEERFR